MRNPDVAAARVARAEMVKAFISSTEYRDRFGKALAPASVSKMTAGSTKVKAGTVTSTFYSVSSDGLMTVAAANPWTVALPPAGYTFYRDVAFNVSASAAVTPPYTVTFDIAWEVSDPTEFAALRVLHMENGLWVDRTVLSPDTPAPNFINRNISARANTLGTFAIARLTNSNHAPLVSLSQPISGEVLQAPATINLNANASDADGNLTKVQFYQGETLLGEDSAAPYSLPLANLGVGNYAFRAKAIDGAGASTFSAYANVSVVSPPAPTGSLSAVPGQINVCDGSGLGVISLSWTTTGASTVSLRTGAPNGAELTSGGPTGSFTTAKTIDDGATIYLQNTTGGLALTSANTLATVTLRVTSNGCAQGGRTNFALAANGGVATASSTYSSAYAVSKANNGERRGANWGSPTSSGDGGWNEAAGASPDWLQIDFTNGSGGAVYRNVDEIDLFSLQDQYTAPVEPTEEMTFTTYGVVDFDLQYWTGTAWANVPAQQVTGNNKVWRRVTFTPVTTNKVRVWINRAADGMSRVVELEAWGRATSDTVWVEDALPAGAGVDGSQEAWSWVTTNPAPFSGTSAHQSSLVAGMRQHHFYGATQGLRINAGDTLFTYVYLDPANVPNAIILQWDDGGGSWEHSAYWTSDVLNWGLINTEGRRHMGAMPPAGQWIRLEVPAGLVGLEGRTVTGMSFGLVDGRATWDRAGKSGFSRRNVALASNGSTATASSVYSSGYPAAAVINGDRKGTNWGSGGGWHDSTANTWPDWVQVDFPAAKTINEIGVFTIQDTYANPSEPTETQVFTTYGSTSYKVQFWNGTTWVTVPGGAVTGNNNVWRRFAFAPVTTSKIRVSVEDAADHANSRIIEVEAFELIPNQPPVAQHGGPYSRTAGVNVQFNGGSSSDPDGQIVSYSWNFGDGTFGTGVNPTHAYAGAGTYTVTLTVVDSAGDTATAQTTATISPPVTNAATFVSQTAPSSVVAGRNYTATVTMRNSGTSTWSTAGNYNLGSQGPQDNMNWGMARVALPGTIAPGADAVFNFTFRAPTTPGTYTFQWRMVQDTVEWFGASSSSQTVIVKAPPAASALALVAHWKFDEGTGTTAQDATGNGNTGTLQGNPAWSAGKVGPSALNFDGLDDRVTVADNTTLTDITNNFTVSFWVNPRSTHQIDPESVTGVAGVGGQRYAFGPRNAPGTDAGAGISVGTNGVSVYEHGAGYMPATLVYQATLSGWTHVAVVYENKQPRLYINGALVRTGLTSPRANVILHPQDIGGMAYGYLDGLLDDVRVYNHVLGASEIQTLAYEAAFVSQSVPATMTAGQTYPVTVTLRNTGATSWASADSVTLGTQNPQDNVTWGNTTLGNGRVALPATVAPGGDATFTFNVTAPSTPGTYNFQRRMVRGTSGWFGGLTPNVAVTVTAPPVQTTVFSDDYNDNRLDTTKWRYSNSSSASIVLEQNQRLELPLRPNSAGYYGVQTLGSHDLRERTVSVDVVQATSQGGWTETYFQIKRDEANYYHMSAGAGSFVLDSWTGGVRDRTVLAFDPTNHRFWRFRHDQASNTMNFETSANATTWTTQKIVTVGFSLDSMYGVLLAGAWGTGNSTPGAAVFDNFTIKSNSANQPPSVSLTKPAHNATFGRGTTVTLAATAADADGGLQKVEFFEGPNKLGEDATAPYSIAWSNVKAGNYFITARATDSNGAMTTSNGAYIAVSNSQTVEALLVVSDAVNLPASDGLIKARLENLGFTVTVKDAVSAVSSDATNKSLVYISETVASTNVTTKFRDVAVPVILAESQLFDDMLMTGPTNETDYGYAGGQNQVIILDPSHPLAAGCTGTVTVSIQVSGAAWGRPSASAAQVASMSYDGTKKAIFAYESGAMMVGMQAPARRVGLFHGNDAYSSLTGNGGALFDAAVRWASTPPPSQYPYNNTPATIPGTVQIEQYDEGGEGLAYHDTMPGNEASNTYRYPTDVDAWDGGIGYVQAGEWLEYTVNVSAAGSYKVDVSLAAAVSGGVFHIEFDGLDVTGPMQVPNTGSWGAYQTISKSGFNLTAGQHVMRVVMDANGSNGYVANFDSLTVSALPPVGSASFVKSDTTTKGSWRGVYGNDGYRLAGEAAFFPSYAQITTSGRNDYTWAATTTDVRAVQKASNGADRIAACWYNGTEFNVNVDVTDGWQHHATLYVLDWDGNDTRQQRIDVIDVATGTVLDSRSLTAYSGGQYLVWNVKGSVTFRVVNTGATTSNAVVSGLFLDTPTAARWKFDEGSGLTAADASGNGNTGTLLGNQTWSAGKIGTGSLDFDGLDDRVSVAPASNLANVSNNFTVSFWANPRSTHQIDPESVTGVAGVGGQRWAIEPINKADPNAGAGISVGTNGVSVYEHAPGYMPATLVYQATLSGWTHIAVVYENRRPRLYINGLPVRVGLTSPRASVFIQPPEIGGMSYGYFDGQMDDVRIYNQPLDTAQIQHLAQGSPLKNLALGRPATQSSTYTGATVNVSADRAVDGNTDGNSSSLSITHTNNDNQARWEVDLGYSATIQNITLWNRTDCCSTRLSNFYVFVSDVPFTATDTTVQNQPGVWTYVYSGAAGTQTIIPVGRSGRYVRVQLSGLNYLTLAEVEVWGMPKNGPVFGDNFNDNALDWSKWGVNDAASATTVREQNQRLEIALQPSVAGYNGVTSPAMSFVNRSAQVEVVQPLSQGGWVEQGLQLVRDGSNVYNLSIGAGSVAMDAWTNGVRDRALLNYNPAAHRFLRIRHDPAAQTVNFELSADGQNWTVGRTVAVTFPLTSMKLNLFAGAFGTGNATPGTAIFDNLRLDRNDAGGGGAIALTAEPTNTQLAASGSGLTPESGETAKAGMSFLSWWTGWWPGG
ncbi:MAG TPA: LamG-like jellyroll fold domain-containing protein [Pyrinomonadaceae bacterium]|nr:LamG-like jellyroll fold domain-containing protein [Pyrinomonadaceae bacterium]